MSQVKAIFLILVLGLSCSCASQKAKDETLAEQKEEVAKVFSSKISPIRKCYEDGIQKIDPKPEGQVVLHLLIDSQGLANIVQIKKTTLNNKDVEDCMVSTFQGARFPSPMNGNKEYSVSYPFTFRLSKRGYP
jgi:hypothetical protein